MGAEIFMSVLTQLGSYYDSIIGTLMGSFGGFARAIVYLYFVLMAIGFVKASFGEHTKELAFSALLLVFLHTFVMETSAFKEWIMSPFLNLVFNLSSFFLRSGPGNDSVGQLFSRLDATFVLMKNTLDQLWPNSSFLMDAPNYIKATFALGLMTLTFGAAYIAYLMLLIVSVFGMYVLFIVGGICIFFGAFKKTRFITWAWCRALANYGLLMIFASIVMGICINGLESSMTQLAANSDPSLGYFTREIGYVVAWSLLTVGLLLKSADFAAALSGGMAGSTSMVTGGLAMAGGAIFSGAQMITQNQYTRAAAGRFASSVMNAGPYAYSKMLGIARTSSEQKGIERR